MKTRGNEATLPEVTQHSSYAVQPEHKMAVDTGRHAGCGPGLVLLQQQHHLSVCLCLCLSHTHTCTHTIKGRENCSQPGVTPGIKKTCRTTTCCNKSNCGIQIRAGVQPPVPVASEAGLSSLFLQPALPPGAAGQLLGPLQR